MVRPKMTKEFYKNPLFYYIAVPVIAAGWVLLIWTVRLPQAHRKWDVSRAEYTKAQELITEILKIDPAHAESKRLIEKAKQTLKAK